MDQFEVVGHGATRRIAEARVPGKSRGTGVKADVLAIPPRDAGVLPDQRADAVDAGEVASSEHPFPVFSGAFVQVLISTLERNSRREQYYRGHGRQRRDERLRRSRWQMFGNLEADGQIEPLWHVDLLPQVHAAKPRLVNQQQIAAVMPIESENLANPMPLEKAEPLSMLAAEINDAPRTDVFKNERCDDRSGGETVVR